MAGNRIQLWGKVLAEPELRTTPAGTSVLRIIVEAGDFALAVSMTGEAARKSANLIRVGAEVMVSGSLKAARKPTKSGIVDTTYEVSADSVDLKASD